MSVREITYLRTLARQYLEIARSDRMQTTISRWKDLVSGKRADRAMVLCRVNRATKEIHPDSSYVCNDPFLRKIEEDLRWGIFTAGLGDDHCVFPYYPCQKVVTLENPPRFGVELEREDTGLHGGAWKTVPPIRDESDLEKLALPVWRYDEEATDRRRALLEEILGDILEIRPVGGFGVNVAFDQIAETLLGMNELLLGLSLNPSMIHSVMGFLRDYALSTLEQLEEMEILTENNDGHKHNSYSIKRDPESPVTAKDLWIWSNSQVFGAVGPDHFNEFLLEYQKPIFRHFGAVSYGCCEDLTRKIDHIVTIPSLKIFVSSHWTDLEVVTPKCAERSLCIEWRQLATDMMGEPDFDAWERHLRKGLEVTEGLRRYIVLQEVETIEGDVEKFRRWCDLAVQVCEENA